MTHKHGSPRGEHATAGAGPVRIWDLPTRLFHWLLAALVLCSVVTAKLGGLWIDWHMRAGYAILALVLFRVLWGFAGSRYAREYLLYGLVGLHLAAIAFYRLVLRQDLLRPMLSGDRLAAAEPARDDASMRLRAALLAALSAALVGYIVAL